MRALGYAYFVKGIIYLIFLLLYLYAHRAQAYTTHCQRNGGPVYACHICTRGHNAMTLTEYECSAREERRQHDQLGKHHQ